MHILLRPARDNLVAVVTHHLLLYSLSLKKILSSDGLQLCQVVLGWSSVACELLFVLLKSYTCAVHTAEEVLPAQLGFVL